jgi:hypothetical protein
MEKGSPMTAVEVEIVQPADGATIVGASAVDLIGRVGTLPAELSGVPLYYRWYSSEFPATEGHFSLNDDALLDPALAYPAPLAIGSQAITLAASDQQGQDTTAQNDTRHGGVAGGAKGPKRCVVHVFRAVLRRPAAGDTLSKAASTVEADAPLHWPDAEYQKLNRLRYRWRFEPDPADGRVAADLIPAANALQLVFENTTPVVRYDGPLPTLDLGGYTMLLRVEDVQNPAVGDTASVPVVIAS